MSEVIVETIPLEEFLRRFDAIREYASARTVGLLLFVNGVIKAEDAHAATGVGVQIADRYFIATAGHNLKMTPDSGLTIVSGTVSQKQPPFLRRWPAYRDPDPTPDVGYIEIAPEVAQRLSKGFVGLSEIKIEFRAVGTWVALDGHPRDHIPKDQITREHLFNLREVSLASNTIELPAGKDKDAEIAVAIHPEGRDSKTGERIATPGLKGFSGGGIWTMPAVQPSGVWTSSRSLLAGIQHSWIPQSQVALCVQMQHWLALIARDYPDLAETIGHMGRS